MKTRRSTKLFATVAAASLVLAACGGDDDAGDEGTADVTDETSDETTAEPTEDTAEPTEDTAEPTEDTADTADTAEPPTGGTVTYANAQEFSNYNNNLATSNSVKNGIIVGPVLPDTYEFNGPGGGLVMDTDVLVSAEILSTDPQVIEYVIQPAAVWSDGDPIDCDDFYLSWIALNGALKQLDESGNPIIDPDTETELLLFEAAGTTGTEDIESIECSEDGKTVTTTYSQVFADWQSLFTGMMPAHIVEQESGVADLIAAYDSEDREALEALAAFYNTGWALNPGELKPEIMPSGDALMVSSWEAGATLTLVPNPSYWGTPSVSNEIVVRYIAEEAQAQALANGEINAMDPQPTPDLLAQLGGIDGVTVETAPQFVWEHFDFNFANEALQNRDVREAFAYCLPREQIVANLIKPLAPDAIILNNRYNQEFEASYADSTEGVYDTTDLDKAKELLEGSGVSLPIDLRLGWFNNGGNARRTDQVALTIESCNQVGFNITDTGNETFFDVELDAGDWDIAMFAWAGSPLKTGSSAAFTTGGGNNNGSYSNPEVDALADTLGQTLDADEQAQIGNQIDAILWEDLATIPVFSFPGIVAYSDNTSNIVPNPSQNGLTWNAFDWSVA